jgi:6-phosphogluconate dehydrogenase
MNRSILSVSAVVFMIGIQPTLAQTVKPADKSSQANPPVMSVEEFDKQLARMQDHMMQMQAQMDKVSKTQDPQERQRLLQDHWASMQAAMSRMRGMWGPGGAACCGGSSGTMGPGMMMGGPMMGWSHMQGYYSKLTPEQHGQRQYMMDQYMPMQQMMMDHMMWHQRWMNPPPATK